MKRVTFVGVLSLHEIYDKLVAENKTLSRDVGVSAEEIVQMTAQWRNIIVEDLAAQRERTSSSSRVSFERTQRMRVSFKEMVAKDVEENHR